VIGEGKTGVCGVRVNNDGKLYAAGYGVISSLSLDPIEKKPLYHFHRGSTVLSAGSFGCNFRCPFCQNHTISMPEGGVENALGGGEQLSPERLAEIAVQAVSWSNIGLAYTYNEPFINYEYVSDCAALIRKAGLKNVAVTNGYINEEPLSELLRFIDALNIDLKAMDPQLYRKAGGDVEDIKRTIKTAAKHAHVEVTTLIIPGENDSADETERIARFIADISPDIPLHLTRFFPNHLMNEKQPTPKEKIHELTAIAQKYLKYFHPGNLW
jgi:pyruvate formate lyase activating enzyme